MEEIKSFFFLKWKYRGLTKKQILKEILHSLIIELISKIAIKHLLLAVPILLIAAA